MGDVAERNGAGDVDLHVHNANNTAWFNGDDCYYGNLRPAWGAVLDFDNTSTVGPENTRLDAPAVGSSYVVGVHNYARAQGRVATVQIFCGSTTSTTGHCRGPRASRWQGEAEHCSSRRPRHSRRTRSTAARRCERSA